MILTGKVSAQPLKYAHNMEEFTAICAKCSTLMPAPAKEVVKFNEPHQVLIVHSYLDTSHFIYETKSGISIVYCSKDCKEKHRNETNS
jgi:hypothetical protein